MTPQLQQAIKLLQMSRMELVDMVREEMLENPILEENADGDDDGNRDGEESSEAQEGASAEARAEIAEGGNSSPGESATVDSGTSEARGAEPSEVSLQEQAVEALQSGDPMERTDGGEESAAASATDDIDWEKYLENHSLESAAPAYRPPADEELPGIEATYSRSMGLTEHLVTQLRVMELLEDETRFAALVIGNLDDDGYLKLDQVPEDEVVLRLADQADLDAEDAEEVLHLIQQLDPVGVASRSLSECLQIQAKHRGYDQLVLDIVTDHIGALEKHNYTAIARDLNVEVEEVYDCAQVIAELEPRPARNFVTEEPRYITPDVYVHKVGDRYFVVSNDDGLPKLRISGFYRAAMGEDAQAREYIQNKLRSAQWLIRSIDQRRKTIVRVTECIVEKQKDFFDKGVSHLKPMILRDVAEEVSMHESTISRVTSNKYVHTHRGIFELKYFFNSAIRRDNQSDIASESVKQSIKRLISAEDTKQPLSDQNLVELLAQDNVKIARRTVAKYREMLGILSSGKRKRYF